ncbi:MAG: hypothetical protein GY778_29315 [bacterium]|nr:hypothetical protein [bacterium]
MVSMLTAKFVAASIAVLAGQIDPLTHVATLTDGLVRPARLAVTPTEVLAADPQGNAIVRFDLTGAYLGTWSEPLGPVGVAVHPDGRIFVARRDDATVAVHDGSYAFLRVLNPTPFSFVRPTDLEIDPVSGRLYVVDSGADRFLAFDTNEALALVVGARGDRSDEFKYPAAITVDGNVGMVVVADQDNFRAKMFTDSGVWVSSFGYRNRYLPGGDEEGWFARPAGLAFDTQGRIYVTDALMSTLRIFDSTGAELGKVLTYGFGAGELRTPGDVAVDATGRIWVANSGAGTVEIYDAPGARRSAAPEAPVRFGRDWMAYPDPLPLIPGWEPPHMLDDVLCGHCHGIEDQPGGHLGLTEGQANLCFSCHTGTGQALGMLVRPTATVGMSHAWGVPAINPAYGSVGPTPGGAMAFYLDAAGNIKCATCHNQHNNEDGTPYLRVPANVLCQDCHADHVIHTPSGAWQPTCLDCHTPHDPDDHNLSLVRASVDSRTLGVDKAVVFTARTGPNSFDDGDPAANDGICQICHTATDYHMHDGTGVPHNDGTDCTSCHPHDAGFMPVGGSCTGCHGQPPDGDVSPNTAGSHAFHMTDPSGPQLADCFTCHAGLSTGNHNNGSASFATGVDADGNGDIDLSETDVCDACHSPDGSFDGSAEGKTNWDASTSVSCEGCHDTGSSTIQGVSAPPVAGDNSTWGYYATGHGRTGMVECTACHDPSSPHFDGVASTYSFDSSYYGPTQSGVAYAAGFRLKDVNGEVPLMIPANYNITFGYDSALMRDTAFRLCFECHDGSKLLDDTPGDGIDSNFKASLPNPPRNYSYAWGSGADVNEHVAHIMNYIGPFADSDWDTDTTGSGGSDGHDTLIACSSCHNVHGAAGTEGSTNEVMVRDGILVGRTGFGFSYVVEDDGAGGFPWVTSTDATRAASVGAILRSNTSDMCAGSMCHDNPAPPVGTSYDAIGSGWGTYLEYYREPISFASGCGMCHSRAVDNGDGLPAGGRRGVVGEFPVGDAHAHYGGSELTDAACTVCHDQATHMDGYVDLFDPDGGAGHRFVTSYELTADPSDPDLSGFCGGCHDADGATRLAAPMDPFGDGNAPADVDTRFQGTRQWDEWYGDWCFGEEGMLRPVNAHHDVPDADQAGNGTRIECLHCHGGHTAGASQPVSDPFDTTTAWAGSGNDFCLACHFGGTGPLDAGFPAGVMGPTIDTTDPRWPPSFWDGSTWNDILGGACITGDCSSIRGVGNCEYEFAPWEVDYEWAHSAHGAASKRGWAGYSGAPAYELNCTDCHDPHGSYTAANPDGNPYMIRDYVDGTQYVDDGTRSGGFSGPPWDTYGIAGDVVITVSGIDVGWPDLCGKCHTDWANAAGFYHSCTGCQTCHIHGGAWGEYDWGDAPADDVSCLSGRDSGEGGGRGRASNGVFPDDYSPHLSDGNGSLKATRRADRAASEGIAPSGAKR